jgi:hypothetical protein
MVRTDPAEDAVLLWRGLREPEALPCCGVGGVSDVEYGLAFLSNAIDTDADGFGHRPICCSA